MLETSISPLAAQVNRVSGPLMRLLTPSTIELGLSKVVESVKSIVVPK